MTGLIVFGAKSLYVFIVAGALWYIYEQSPAERKRIVLTAFLALPLSYVVAKLASHFYYDARPFVEGHFVPLISHIPDNGFPSDHTLLSAAVAAVIFFFHRTLGALFLVLAFLVGVARVAAGIHHMTDVIGSMIIAVIVTYAVYTYVLPKVWEKFGMTKTLS